MPQPTHPNAAQSPEAVSGVQLAQGVGHQPAAGFWSEAWAKVLKRPAAVFGLAWIAAVAVFAVISPLIASGHPLILTDGGESPLGVFVSRGLGAFFDPATGLTATIAALLAGLAWALTPSRMPSAFAAAFGVVLAIGYGVAGARFFGIIPAAAWHDWLLAALAGVGGAWLAIMTGAPLSFRLATCWVPLLIAACVVLPRAGVGDASPTFQSPLFRFLTGVDVLLLTSAGVLAVLQVCRLEATRWRRAWVVIIACVQAGLVVLLASAIESKLNQRDVSEGLRELRGQPWLVPACAAGLALLSVPLGLIVLPFERLAHRAVTAGAVGVVAAWIVTASWGAPLERFTYARQEASGRISALYPPIPWSPRQGSTSLQVKQPGSNVFAAARDGIVSRIADDAGAASFADDPRFGASRGASERLGTMQLSDELIALCREEIALARPDLSEPVDGVLEAFESAIDAGELSTVGDVVIWLDDRDARGYWLGTDAFGQDVLSQLLHACRLSISIGLVSTSIAVVIGVTLGALMGYFGGWVDMLLYRLVEVFMAIPVLFLLIVAAAVLPRSTYVMMAIIGCFSWTTAARYTRAEFLKLRGQDFVHAARAAGLPLHRVLFRHILPNGVTPVLVDASFLVAAAIAIEVILSYLGLGPPNQASWGRLLSDATNELGQFVWWLALIPGLVIFLTVLSYNLIGEALRDAIDPRLGKARV